MSHNDELRATFEELKRLRASRTQTSVSAGDKLVGPVTQLAQKQLASFQVINDFLKLFVEEAVIKTRSESIKDCIVMPTRESALDLIQTVDSAVEIHNQVVGVTETDCNTEKLLNDNYKKTLNKLASCDLSNQDFNRCFRGATGRFNGQTEIEEFTDSTVNTIVSEDVLTSSPL